MMMAATASTSNTKPESKPETSRRGAGGLSWLMKVPADQKKSAPAGRRFGADWCIWQGKPLADSTSLHGTERLLKFIARQP
jgi:hypothetical protein